MWMCVQDRDGRTAKEWAAEVCRASHQLHSDHQLPCHIAQCQGIPSQTLILCCPVRVGVRPARRGKMGNPLFLLHALLLKDMNSLRPPSKRTAGWARMWWSSLLCRHHWPHSCCLHTLTPGEGTPSEGGQPCDPAAPTSKEWNCSQIGSALPLMLPLVLGGTVVSTFLPHSSLF